MFFISTLHLVLGIYRLCQAFVHAGVPGGMSAYFANVMRWEDIAINVLYGTQEVLGNSAAVCYSHNRPSELVLICLSTKGLQMLRPLE